MGLKANSSFAHNTTAVSYSLVNVKLIVIANTTGYKSVSVAERKGEGRRSESATDICTYWPVRQVLISGL